jgi:hypothetical protein
VDNVFKFLRRSRAQYLHSAIVFETLHSVFHGEFSEPFRGDSAACFIQPPGQQRGGERVGTYLIRFYAGRKDWIQERRRETVQTQLI